MDLMSLLATLTLDKNEYDKGLEEAEKQAEDLKIPEPKIPKPDTEPFTAGLKEAEEEGSVFSEVMTGVWQGLKDSLVTTGIVGIVSGMVGYMKQGITLAVQGGKAISDGAKNLQISTKAYQEYEYVLGKSQLSINDLATAMKNIDKIRGGEISDKQIKWFENLGVNAEAATSGLMSAEEVLNSVMNSLASYEGADKGAIIDWFFGKNTKWKGYFEQTEEEVRALKKEAQEMGLIMSDEDIENAVTFNDTVEKIQDTLQGIQLSFGEQFLPMLSDLISGIAEVVKWLSGNGGEGDLNNQLKNVESNLAKDQAAIEGAANSARDYIEQWYGMSDAEQQAAQSSSDWKSKTDWMLEAFPELAKYIDASTGAITGEKQAILDQITALEEQADAQAKANSEQEKSNVLSDAAAKLKAKEEEASAKLTEAENKRTEQEAMANKLLENNPVLAKLFQNQFGEGAQFDKMSENYGQMINWLTMMAGTKGIDASGINELGVDVELLMGEYQSLRAEAEGFANQLQEAMAATGASAGEAAGTVQAVTDALNGIPTDVYSTIHITTEGGEGVPRAIGDHYIPYDNFPALLHRGERVLTATENRRGVEGGGSTEMIAALQGLRNDIQNIDLVVGKKTFGRAVVNHGGRRVRDYIGRSESRYSAGYGT